MNTQHYQQQLNYMQLTSEFHPKAFSFAKMSHLRDKSTSNHQPAHRMQFEEGCQLESDDIFAQELGEAKMQFAAFPLTLPAKIKSNRRDNKSLDSSIKQPKIEEKGERKRKTRQAWTVEKYEKLLLQFRNLQLGISTKSLKDLAKEMDFCVRIIQIKWNEYQYNKSLASIVSTLTNTAKNTRVRSITSKTALYITLIRQILARNSLVTTTEIANIINQHFQTNKSQLHKHQVSADTVARLLKKQNYSYEKIAFIPKHPRKLLPEKDIIERRYQYCELYKSFLSSGAQIIFLDQTEISLYLKKKFCWIKKDREKPKALIIPKDKQSSISLLCIITRTGAAGWRLFQQPLSKETFTATLKEILKKFLEKTNATSRKILIMDNESIHKMQVINMVSAVKDAFEIFYLPPYSQLFNPIECFFRELKDNIKSKKWFSKKELLSVTKEILEGYKTFSFKPYFNRVESYIEEGKYKIKSTY